MVLHFVNSVWNAFLAGIIAMCNGMMIRLTHEPSESPDEEPALKLTYFDIPGLAQAVRNTFEFGGIKYEDERLTKEAFGERKANLPYGQLPILTVDNETQLAQSKAILRYASRLAKTYPRDPLNAAIIDQWTELHSEFMALLGIHMYPERHGLLEAGYDKTKHRAFLLETHIPKYLKLLEAELGPEAEEDWLGGFDSITMADLAWHATLKWLQSGVFDGFDAESLSAYPSVVKYLAEIDAQLADEESGDSISDTDEAEGDEDAATTEGDGESKKNA